MNRKNSLVLSSGAFFMGLAFAWAFYTPRTLALKQLQSVVQVETDTRICPLSDKQTQDSIEAFAKMVPTFTHPRCINCHGAVNPFASNTDHIGGRVGVKFGERTVRDEILGKDITVVEPEDQLTLRLCEDCHSAAPSWSPPPPEKWFVGKTTVQLCEQMKDQSNNQAEDFLFHIEHDSLGLIPEGFNGTRGLDDNGQGIYEQETGNDFKPEPPPPFSLAMFVQQARDWIETTGGQFKGGKTCGCEPHHYILKLSTDETFTYVDANGRAKAEGHAELSIPLTFKDDGSFTGQATVKRPWQGTIVAGDVTCQSKFDFQETWKVEGTADKVYMNGKMTLARPQFVASSVCSIGGKTTTGTGQVLADQGTHEFELDALVGQSQTLEFKGFLDNAKGGDAWIINATIVDEGK